MKYLFGVVLAAAVACEQSDPAARRYSTRGAVTQVNEDRGELSVAIHHERIERFEDRDGKPSAMASMQMLFGVAPTVPRGVFQQGAKLAFAFDVRWDRQPTLLIVKAETLSAETELVLSAGH